MRRPPAVQIARDLIVKQKGRCAYCNHSLVSAPLEWDHFVPYSFSQMNPSDNWVASCKKCNNCKSNKHLRTESALIEFCLKMISKHGELSEDWPEGHLREWPWLTEHPGYESPSA